MPVCESARRFTNERGIPHYSESAKSGKPPIRTTRRPGAGIRATAGRKRPQPAPTVLRRPTVRFTRDEPHASMPRSARGHRYGCKYLFNMMLLTVRHHPTVWSPCYCGGRRQARRACGMRWTAIPNAAASNARHWPARALREPVRLRTPIATSPVASNAIVAGSGMTRR